jgi:hypothetical protein
VFFQSKYKTCLSTLFRSKYKGLVNYFTFISYYFMLRFLFRVLREEGSDMILKEESVYISGLVVSAYRTIRSRPPPLNVDNETDKN